MSDKYGKSTKNVNHSLTQRENAISSKNRNYHHLTNETFATGCSDPHSLGSASKDW